jgi:hypothetical protein
MAAAEKEVKAKTEVETVTMTDGRQVEFAGKRKMVKETLIPATTRSGYRGFRYTPAKQPKE